MEFKDYYQALELQKDAGSEEIKRAYRGLARQFHPDINASPEAETRFREITEAYEVLKDPERRAAYDRLWNQQQQSSGGAFTPPPGWQQGFSFTSGGTDRGEVFSDFFETLFRRPSPFAKARHERSTSQHARIRIDIPDAYTGGSRVLTLQTPVAAEDGTVQLKSRDIPVYIPKGIVEGQHIRLPGQGPQSPGGGPPGDLLLEVFFAPHPVYRADGKDLYLDLPLAPWEAVLGGKIRMPAPVGSLAVKVPPNARNGQILRLRGKGLPGSPSGDIYATFKIVNPKVTTDTARRLFEQMAREIPFNPRASIGG
ncbi:DnaJ C-terminal domain-containing protein [Leisingera aquaemixtae]|uniref:Curved DNA-binding protein n=1 Tax=Leisingera aquaemixtae TaxID=1396826 RepID=A0A0N7M5E2_9RHOB|nr:DnaJ C-terminal domain-containing protein [Leisingera aquaemixtae]CUI02186.1 Curved DNA-binding protein [Leisingera aquaemixtae]